jgi:hypothetical protein
MGFNPVAVVLQDTTHKTTQAIKDTLHTMNTMQIKLQLHKLILLKISTLYTKQ